MHEGPMVHGLIETALVAAGSHGVQRITGVHVVVDDAAGVDAHALRAHFAVHAAGTAVDGADLIIRHEPARAVCWDCAAPVVVEAGIRRTCPECGGTRLRAVPGRPPFVEAIDVDAEGEA